MGEGKRRGEEGGEGGVRRRAEGIEGGKEWGNKRKNKGEQ